MLVTRVSEIEKNVQFLKKQFDVVLIGHHYASFILAQNLMARGKSVLLLDDDRAKFGSGYSKRLNLLEINFLKVIGEDNMVGTLIELDRHLEHVPFMGEIEGRQLQIGHQSPWTNLLECLRKFPEIFEGVRDLKWFQWEAPEDFDQHYFSYLSRVANHLYQFHSPEGLTIQPFLTHLPDQLKDIFHLLQTTVKEQNDESLARVIRSFLYFFRMNYHHQMSVQVSELELMHLFLSILSPQYFLNERPVLQELTRAHLERGGLIKKTSVRDWKFHRGKPWVIELASFEGVIHPGKLCFLGGVPEKFQLRTNRQFPFYRNLVGKYLVKEGIPETLQGFHFLKLKKNSLGVDLGTMELYFGSHEIEFSSPVEFQQGSKPDFYQQEVWLALAEVCRHFLPHLPFQSPRVEFQFGDEIWVVDEEFGPKMMKKDRNFHRKISLIDQKTPIQWQKLSNFSYFGPLKKGALGLLSLLMEIKETQRYM